MGLHQKTMDKFSCDRETAKRINYAELYEASTADMMSLLIQNMTPEDREKCRAMDREIIAKLLEQK